MTRPAVLALLAVVALARAAAAGSEPPPLDARAFFERLAERYRALETYEDVTDVVEVTTREGEPPHRVQTRIMCRVSGQKLAVTTPAGQAAREAGLDPPLKRSPAMASLVRRYNLWLAPHLVLRFSDRPLQEFRAGVPEGFAPASAERSETEAGTFVRLTLASNTDPPGAARFVLHVNRETMLIERIEGREPLPDGAEHAVELSIEPVTYAQG